MTHAVDEEMRKKYCLQKRYRMATSNKQCYVSTEIDITGREEHVIDESRGRSTTIVRLSSMQGRSIRRKKRIDSVPHTTVNNG